MTYHMAVGRFYASTPPELLSRELECPYMAASLP